jgi:integrase
MAKVEYQRVKKRLTPQDVAHAVWMSQRPSPKARVIEWADTDCAGLTLRITQRDAAWLIRRRDCTIRIGECKNVGLPTARYVTYMVRDAAKRGRDLKVFVETLVHSESGPYRDPEAWKIADEIADDRSELGRRRLVGEIYPTWTWRNMTKHFLAEKLPELKATYRKDYERYLTLPEFELINDRPVSEIKLAELEIVRDRMIGAYGRSTVSRAVRQSKEMLNWAWSYNGAKAGLDKYDHEWWVRWKIKYKSKVRIHRPTIEELARTMVIADEFRKLADDEHESYPGTVCALWMAVLTAQRTGSLLMMRPNRLFDPDAEMKQLRGWQIANWTNEEMKGGRDGGRPHSLPLPPRLLRTLARFRAESRRHSEWMFFAKRPQDRLTQSALNLLMYRLQGRVFDHGKKNKPDRPGKPGPKPAMHGKIRKDLFAEFNIRPWTLHDVRRSLTRFLDDRRLGGAASAILGHKRQNEKMPEEERMAEVTELHYNSAQRISLKAEGIKLWVDTILDACERERVNIKKRIASQSRAISSGMVPDTPPLHEVFT